MFCSKCGKDLPEGTRFCPNCGAAVTGPVGKRSPDGTLGPKPSTPETKSATAVKEKPAKKQGRKPLLIAALAVVLVVIVIFVLFKLLKSATRLEDDGTSPADTAVTDSNTPEQDSGAELLAIINQAEAVHQEAIDAHTALNESDAAEGAEKFRQRAQIYEDFLKDLDELRVKADAVSGLDDKLKTAKDEYFTMLHDARTALAEVFTLLADYLEFSRDYVDQRPQYDGYTVSEYSEALSGWSQETGAAYAAISYPSCVEDIWKQYGSILEYNESIAEKITLALRLNDWLRFYSATGLEDRYKEAEKNQYMKLLNCLDGEIRFADTQRQIASNLAGEIHTYAEMTPDEKNTYEFEHIHTGKVLWECDAVETIYPSLYSTYDAFAILRTGCVSGKKAVIVEAEIEGFTQQYRESFTLDAAYREIYIKPPALTGDLDLTAAKPAQLKVTISEQDGTVIDTKSFPVTLKSKYDFDWYSDEYGTATQYNILCYLTPEASAITQLKREAINELQEMAGIESFVGYQSLSDLNQFVGTYLQTAGLMHALYADLDVRYNMNPFSISGSSQHIQLPEDVIANRSGLCVETSLVIASALQSANMHAFLLFPPGHAQVAVEVWDSGENAGKYFLIETTELSGDINTLSHFVDNAVGMLKDPENKPSSGIITYFNSSEWYYYLQDVECVVDCDDSRLLGMTPFAN